MPIQVVYPGADGNPWAGIIVEGVLAAYSQDGGFGADEIMVGDSNMSEIISQLFRVDLDSRGSLGPSREFGRVRLTIEIVAPGQE